MPRLLRPHIPVAVELQVAERQLRSHAIPGFPVTSGSLVDAVVGGPGPQTLKLNTLLDMLRRRLGDDDVALHLDHDPPLGARKKVFRSGVHVDYDPPANDPNHLIYREATAHRVKTNVRGEHGQHPDRVLIKKNRRLERGPKPKAKKRWPSRPLHGNTRWPPKGSRPLGGRKA